MCVIYIDSWRLWRVPAAFVQYMILAVHMGERNFAVLFLSCRV